MSWGEIAVGEYRPTADRPTRSAIVGLISAAIGIRRDEEERLRTVAEGYRFAFRMNASGLIIRDYHTSQVPTSGTGRNRKDFPTRRDELLDQTVKITTILSSRDYQCDNSFTVFVTAMDSAPYSLEKIQKYLQEPVFTLSLGRKSCPLALPLNPVIVTADTLSEVCKMVPPPLELYQLTKGNRHRIFWEDGVQSDITPEFSMIRRDNPISRKRWQFSTRKEYVRTIGKGGIR